MTKRIRDSRVGSTIKVTVAEMLCQRIMAIAAGYEDCNDHDILKSDPMLKLACGRFPITGGDLASQPTLSRFENSVSSTDLWRMEEVLLELFMSGHCGSKVRRLIIDADATDDPAHGQQQFEFFHGFYDCHCFLPLLVYVTADDGEQELVASVLRAGNVHAARPPGVRAEATDPALGGVCSDASLEEAAFWDRVCRRASFDAARSLAVSRGQGAGDDAQDMADDADELSAQRAMDVCCVQTRTGASVGIPPNTDRTTAAGPNREGFVGLD